MSSSESGCRFRQMGHGAGAVVMAPSVHGRPQVDHHVPLRRSRTPLASTTVASRQSAAADANVPIAVRTIETPWEQESPEQALGCKCGCNRTGLFAVAPVRRCSLKCLEAPVSGTFARQRAGANVPVVGWQCGGQGFESPQLHPLEGTDSLGCRGFWPRWAALGIRDSPQTVRSRSAERLGRRVVHTVGYVVQIVLEQPGIGIEGHRGRRMAEHPLDGLNIRSRGHRQARRRMPELVRAQVVEFGASNSFVEHSWPPVSELTTPPCGAVKIKASRGLPAQAASRELIKDRGTGTRRC
ncbi:MAG: hypothetical protein JWN95_1419 [Frankiales bacterium]|nr:hypothetical protein [Frankiales bacterium]